MSDKVYKVVNGTSYDQRTPDAVIRILEDARQKRYRVHVHYGYTEPNDKSMPIGRDWCELHDVTGYIGRSIGSIKAPLLVYNSRSMGGGAILDHCIVRIRTLGKDAKDLYRHPNYQTGKVEIRPVNLSYETKKGRIIYLTHGVFIDGKNHANFTSEQKAQNWRKKMGI